MKCLILLILFLTNASTIWAACPTFTIHLLGNSNWTYSPYAQEIIERIDSSGLPTGSVLVNHNSHMEEFALPFLQNTICQPIRVYQDIPGLSLISSEGNRVLVRAWLAEQYQLRVVETTASDTLLTIASIADTSGQVLNYSYDNKCALIWKNHLCIGKPDRTDFYELGSGRIELAFTLPVHGDNFMIMPRYNKLFMVDGSFVNEITWTPSGPVSSHQYELPSNIVEMKAVDNVLWCLSAYSLMCVRNLDSNPTISEQQLQPGNRQPVLFAADGEKALVHISWTEFLMDTDCRVLDLAWIVSESIENIYPLYHGCICVTSRDMGTFPFMQYGYKKVGMDCEPSNSLVIAGGNSSAPVPLELVPGDTLEFTGWNVGFENEYRNPICFSEYELHGPEGGHADSYYVSAGPESYYSLIAPADCDLRITRVHSNYNAVAMFGFGSELFAECGIPADFTTHLVSGSQYVLAMDGMAGSTSWWNEFSNGIQYFSPEGWYTLRIIMSESETSVENQLPSEFSLGKAWPNPFNPQTRIELSLSSPAPASVDVYDMLGRRVKRLWAGPHALQQEHIWDGCNVAGSPMASGVYFIVASSAGDQATSKVLLVR